MRSLMMSVLLLFMNINSEYRNTDNLPLSSVGKLSVPLSAWFYKRIFSPDTSSVPFPIISWKSPESSTDSGVAIKM